MKRIEQNQINTKKLKSSRLKPRNIKNRAMIFTLSVMVLVGLLYIIFFNSSIKLDKVSYDAVYNKIKITNDIIRHISGGYLDGVMRTSSLRAVRCMIEYMKQHRDYFSNSSDIFREVMISNTINGNTLPNICDNSKNIRMQYLLNQTNQTLKKYMNIYMNYSLRYLNLTQDNTTNEWHLGVKYKIEFFYNISYAYWKFNVSREVKISIVNLTDPISIVSLLDDSQPLDQAHYRKVIPYIPEVWNVSTLSVLLSNMYYTYNERAPSFLDRMQGKARPSKCCGIETVINTSIFDIYSLKSYFNDNPASYKNISYVDYCFFWGICNQSNSTNRTIYNISYFSNLRLEPYHLSTYLTIDEIATNNVTLGLKEWCGDGICQSYAEDTTNCPTDCH